MPNRKLLPLVFPFVLVSVLAGIWAGWIRIGWAFPLSAVAGKHGALMVGSFLGTLISLERAVVVKNKWAMLVPFLSAISLLLFIIDREVPAFYALALGSLGQAIMMGYFLHRYKELYFTVMLAGSLSWLVGNLMWLTWRSYPLAVPWWIAFLLLLITGERLELTRFLPPGKYKTQLLLAALGLFLAGITLPFHGTGRYLAGTGLIGTGVWLLSYDMATKSVKGKGQQRFSAALLLCGYVWLLISGTMILSGDLYGFIYDAVLHSFFIGFVFSMIFAHGPVILPGVLGIAVKPYHRVLYFAFILLQGSLIARILGDVFTFETLRRWGGTWNGVAILLFFIIMAVLILSKKSGWQRTFGNNVYNNK